MLRLVAKSTVHSIAGNTRLVRSHLCRGLDNKSSLISGMPEKRSMVKLGTHSGSFHCDEALGCFLLKLTDKFKDGEVVRRCALSFLNKAFILCTRNRFREEFNL